MTAYKVLQSVGQHHPGETITFTARQLAAGVDVDDLVGRKVLEETKEAGTPALVPEPAANGTFISDDVPKDGDFANQAEPGNICTVLGKDTVYVNVGTRAEPRWTKIN